MTLSVNVVPTYLEGMCFDADGSVITRKLGKKNNSDLTRNLEKRNIDR